MTEQEAKEILRRIEDELNNQQAPAVSISHIEIHDAGLWARIPQAADVQFLATAQGKTLFGIPVSFGAKASESYTIHYHAMHFSV
ncbi:hypothetical protein [Pseudomonas putida]|uniref:hypothetical protein n=1 Tax=Pseudomonas putida TaxID=303 RepID=UPI0018D7715B|nr:hypothetical protein [Pseudomonas putida]MBH3412543.1 hypothetical protein [Pseudomonas putida]